MAILQAISLLTFVAFVSGQCPTHFTSFGSSINACFKFSAKPLSWEAAEQECNLYSSCGSNDIGHLASVHSQAENEMLLMLYDSLATQSVGPFWIGLNDRMMDGTFTWSDAWMLTYKNFPQNFSPFNTAENCVAVQVQDTPQRNIFRGDWNDFQCNRVLPFVCIVPSQAPLECPAPAGGSPAV